MKFQVLYDTVLARGNLVIDLDAYPEKIAIPVFGYVSFTIPAKRITIGDPVGWDLGIERGLIRWKALTDDWPANTSKYLMFQSDDTLIRYGPAVLLNKKDYAMGFAHGARQEGIYDVGSGKIIKRK